MKSRTVILIFSLMLSCAAFAANEPNLYLRIIPSNPVPGQEITVDVMLKDFPPIYGADIHLNFDPKFLEAADNDEKVSGVQITPGDFLNPKQSFFIQNRADNKKGIVTYAASLLNPAPEAKGNGILAQAVFRVRAAGQTYLRIDKAEFGTRDGKTVKPVSDNMYSLELKKDADKSAFSSLILIAAGCILAGIIILVLKKKAVK